MRQKQVNQIYVSLILLERLNAYVPLIVRIAEFAGATIRLASVLKVSLLHKNSCKVFNNLTAGFYGSHCQFVDYCYNKTNGLYCNESNLIQCRDGVT